MKTGKAAIGETIRKARKRNGLTQAVLAEKSGISPRHMSFIETGRSRPGREVLIRLADTLRLSGRERDAVLEQAGYARAAIEGDPPVVRLLTTAEEISALGDPIRLDLVRVFGEEPRTTTEAAELLGRPATTLYHHVRVLEQSGLIELVETRPRRGTVEKYYRATAHVFRLSPTLRSPLGAEERAEDAVVDAIEAALSDLGSVRGDRSGPAPCGTFVARTSLNLSAEALAELLEEMHALLERYDAPATDATAPYGLTIVGIPAR